MLILVEWSQEAFHDPPSLRVLAETATEHEIVLVCPWRAADGNAVAALRRALPRHELVAILVDSEVAPHERRLVEELLNDGAVPLILSSHDPVPPAVTGWLRADARISPGEGLPQPADAAATATSSETRSGSSKGSR